MRGVPRERRATSIAASARQRHAEDTSGAAHDLDHVRLGVVIEPVHEAEAAAQRRRQQARARRRRDQGERLHRHLHRSCARSLPDDDVELVVLHRRIEDLLDRGRQAVDLVDEQHLVALQRRQDRREVARALDDRARRGLHRHAEFVRDDVRERGLAETRRARHQHVVERFATLAAPPQSPPAGSRGRGPGRCSRRACAAAVRPRIARRRRRRVRSPRAIPACLVSPLTRVPAGRGPGGAPRRRSPPAAPSTRHPRLSRRVGRG